MQANNFGFSLASIYPAGYGRQSPTVSDMNAVTPNGSPVKDPSSTPFGMGREIDVSEDNKADNAVKISWLGIVLLLVLIRVLYELQG